MKIESVKGSATRFRKCKKANYCCYRHVIPKRHIFPQVEWFRTSLCVVHLWYCSRLFRNDLWKSVESNSSALQPTIVPIKCIFRLRLILPLIHSFMSSLNRIELRYLRFNLTLWLLFCVHSFIHLIIHKRSKYALRVYTNKDSNNCRWWRCLICRSI